MVYRLSSDFDFEKVFHEDRMNNKGKRLILDSNQSVDDSPGKEKYVRRLQLEHGRSFSRRRGPLLRLHLLIGRLTFNDESATTTKTDGFEYRPPLSTCRGT